MEQNSLLQLSEKNKSKKKILIDGYEVDIENTDKALPPATKKPRKSKQINLTSKQETSDTSKSSETEHLSDFKDFKDMICDPSDNEKLP